MKIFAVLTVVALIGGSQAGFLDGFKDVFHNLEQSVGSVLKDTIHEATPLANQLFEALRQDSVKILSTAASGLLSKLSQPTTTTTTTGTSPTTRDLGDIVSKIGEFVNKGQHFIEENGGNLHAAYHHTLQKIQEEIDHVVNEVKPISGLVSEVKNLVEGHNNFVNELVKQAYPEGVKLFHEILGGHKRNVIDVIDKATHTVETIDKLVHEFGRKRNVIDTIDKATHTVEAIDKLVHEFGRKRNVIDVIDKATHAVEAVDKIAHEFGRRGLLDGASEFASSVQKVLQSMATPLEGALQGLVQKLEGNLFSLLG